MFSKQIFNGNKPPASPSNPKHHNNALFTSQALKTTSTFYSHKKLLKDKDDPKLSPQKNEPIPLDQLKFSNIKPFFTGFHTHNLSENHEETRLTKKNSDIHQNLSNNELVVKKKSRDTDEETSIVKTIPTFEAQHKEAASKVSRVSSVKAVSQLWEETPKNENLLIKNQDTGEVFYINDETQVTRLQEPIKTEYIEKLKKRKKEEIWQDWWNEKKRNNQELLAAVKANNIVQVRKLFEENKTDKKPEINSKDEKDWTCLHFASLAGNYDMVLLLIKMEAEIDPQSNLKQTPLIVAAQK